MVSHNWQYLKVKHRFSHNCINFFILFPVVQIVSKISKLKRTQIKLKSALYPGKCATEESNQKVSMPDLHRLQNPNDYINKLINTIANLSALFTISFHNHKKARKPGY